MRRAILALAVASALAASLLCCGNDPAAKATPDAAAPAPTTTGTAPPADAGPDARRTGCLERPGAPARPDGRLPCELIPPGVVL